MLFVCYMFGVCCLFVIGLGFAVCLLYVWGLLLFDICFEVCCLFVGSCCLGIKICSFVFRVNDRGLHLGVMKGVFTKGI